jgi:hypothetical protein
MGIRAEKCRRRYHSSTRQISALTVAAPLNALNPFTSVSAGQVEIFKR